MPFDLVVSGRNTKKIVALDVETTRPGKGGRPGKHVVEIGAVRMGLFDCGGRKTLMVSDHFSTLVRPPVSINNKRDHGISDADVAEAPTLEQIAPQLITYLEGASFVVAHYQQSEQNLFKELGTLGYSSRVVFLDTAEMAKVVESECFGVKKVGALSLEAVAGRYRCRPLSAHRALDDAIACANVYSLLRLFAKRHGCKGMKGFRKLEEAKKCFTYERVFPARKLPQHKTLSVKVGLRCRVPVEELVLLKTLYWGEDVETVG